MNRHSQTDKFLATLDGKHDWTLSEYLHFCKEGINLAKNFPDEKDKIAYKIAGFGSYLDEKSEALKEIQELGFNLELPDAHIYVEQNWSINDQWQRMENLVEQELAKLT